MIRFSHKTTVFTFRGRALPAPDISTYDASRWTPPSHQIIHVEIQSDGIWCIKLFDTELKTGQSSPVSLKAAKQLIATHCPNLLK